ncbi:phosphatidate cytidylyltransferase [Pararhizobium haloflavum]|uniref:phosphatidate cytidylyltransferase n=1 Tax=Pararhizobium haloflavum TaxID=2037914 RepID=UPI000C19C3E5
MQIELKQRVVSGIVLGLAVLALTFWGGVPFKVFAALLVILIYIEWTAIVGARRQSFQAYATGWLVIGLVGLFTISGAGVLAVSTMFAGAAIAGLLALRTGAAGWIALGIVYAGFSGLAIAELRDDASLGLIGMAFVIAIVWATDIFAYFCGRAIGGPKLARRISPGKTWSGAVFGMFAGIAAGTAVALATLERGGIWIPLLAAILSISSQVGDLFESWIKRKFGAKDSGRLIPGHGGVMDRVDGLVFAAFSAFLIAVIASGGIPTRDAGSPIAASLFAL